MNIIGVVEIWNQLTTYLRKTRTNSLQLASINLPCFKTHRTVFAKLKLNPPGLPILTLIMVRITYSTPEPTGPCGHSFHPDTFATRVECYLDVTLIYSMNKFLSTTGPSKRRRRRRLNVFAHLYSHGCHLFSQLSCSGLPLPFHLLVHVSGIGRGDAFSQPFDAGRSKPNRRSRSPASLPQSHASGSWYRAGAVFLRHPCRLPDGWKQLRVAHAIPD